MDTLTVGVIGAGWMGHVHARAYGRLTQHWPDLPLRPRVAAVADSSPAAASAFARAHGEEVTEYADWRDLVADPSVEAVSVTAPNAMHREIGVAVAEAGKHLWIEKPVGLTAKDALAVRDAVAAAGVVGCVGFNYRHVPAVARARRLVASGAIGTPTHARVQLFTDYAAHPGSPLSWRYAVARGGHGVLGDLASHGVDLLRFVLGDVVAVTAQTSITIPRRPVADAQGHYSVLDVDDPDLTFGEVENEDYVVAILRMASGVIGVCEADRAAVGEQNNYALEVHGSAGLVRWDFRRPGELQVSSGTQYAGQATTTVFSEPGDGEYAAFQPGAGIAMGYDDTKVVEAMNFVRAVAGEAAELATLDDAVASGRALDAMVQSQDNGEWVQVG
ncbi:Gfo/Idh/MocA family protein [Oryzobacter telluris]|uniref:Gfo/Idh/MocA family protein n=1 Tax=Oryzobacter telluris TaxID=3149179 RepID=UPI00370D3F38